MFPMPSNVLQTKLIARYSQMLFMYHAGCGTSSHAASVLITEQLRDEEDYSLEPIQLQVTNIEEFDIVFGRLQDLLNK